MSLLLSRGLFVRVTLETEIFQFPVRHLEPIMACHVFPRHRCAAAAAAGAAAGLAFLHNHSFTALSNQRHALAKYRSPTKGAYFGLSIATSETTYETEFPTLTEERFILPLTKHNCLKNELRPYAFEPSCVTQVFNGL